MFNRIAFSRISASILPLIFVLLGTNAEAAKKPNILIIWGDDIGGFNISTYNQGMMGYRTPNIDSIAKQGAMRTGLTKVGLPGAPEGMKKGRPDDRDEMLRTASTSSTATSTTSTSTSTT